MDSRGAYARLEVVIKALVCLLLILVLCLPASPQGRSSAENTKYKITPTSDPSSTSKVYIPTDLTEAHLELGKMLSAELIQEMKAGAEKDMVMYHHGLGTWIRNNWQLWAGGRLAKYFNSIGVSHPDDMSGIILDTFWCYLNEKPFRLEERVAYYQAFWNANKEPEQKFCPKDGSKVEIRHWLHEDNTSGPPRIVHVGRCKKKHVWAYEVDRGWYEADESLLKKANVKRVK